MNNRMDPNDSVVVGSVSNRQAMQDRARFEARPKAPPPPQGKVVLSSILRASPHLGWNRDSCVYW